MLPLSNLLRWLTKFMNGITFTSDIQELREKPMDTLNMPAEKEKSISKMLTISSLPNISFTLDKISSIQDLMVTSLTSVLISSVDRIKLMDSTKVADTLPTQLILLVENNPSLRFRNQLPFQFILTPCIL